MKNKLTKIGIGGLLCMLLFVGMFVGMLPTVAVAAETAEPEVIEVSTEKEFLDAATKVTYNEGAFIIRLTDDIRLTEKEVIFGQNSDVNGIPFTTPNVTILGNNHSIIIGAYPFYGIKVRKGTMRLGNPDGTDILTIKGDPNQSYGNAMIRISGNERDKTYVYMYKGVTLKDYTNSSTSTDNHYTEGGAVCVWGNGTYNSSIRFSMMGGEILNCKSNNGGAILVRKALFTMSGGTISGNEQTSSVGYGGGVAIVGATFNMNGGEICNNTAKGNGGGVSVKELISDYDIGSKYTPRRYVDGSSFTMTGGKISGNKAEYAGGVYVDKRKDDYEYLDGMPADTKLFLGDLTKFYHYQGGQIYNNTAEKGGDDIVAESAKNITLASINDGLLGSDGIPITDWYYDGMRDTEEKDVNGDPVYDETRWNQKNESGIPYMEVYEESNEDIDIKVYLKAAYSADCEHEFGDDYTEDTKPTCTKPGSESIHCTKCGAIQEGSVRPIPATGHTSSEDWVTDENYHWKVCTVCGAEVEEKPHTFGELIIDKAPTCTDDGSGHKICSECGYEKKEDIEAGHSWESDYTIDVEPTCTTNGSQSIHCQNCNEKKDSEVIPAGHTWDEDYTVDAEPTCTTDGSKSIHCAKCDATKDDTVIPATGHDTSGSWQSDANGHWKECTVCTEKLEIADHIFGELIVDKKPTCIEEGSGHQFCVICQYRKTKVIEANGHTWENAYTVDVEPTCTDEGSKSHHCAICEAINEESEQTIPATGHDVSETWKNDDDKHWKTCKNCTALISEAAHTESDWIVDVAATCTKAGSQHKECTVCGKVLVTEATKATGHTFGATQTYDATCQTAGYTYHVCTVCKVSEKVDDIPVKKHTESDWIVDAETKECVTAGSQHKECTVCGKLLATEVIPAKDHTYGDDITKEATCEEAGYIYHVCTVCDSIEKVGDDIPATGHKESAWIVDAKADCVTAGSRHKECTVCKKILKTEAIPATGHTWKPDQVDKAPTCTETGIDHKECEICGHMEIFEIEATGHTPSETWETDDHERWRVCTVCGAVVEEIPHTFGELIVDKEPTCTEPGSGHRICSGCGYKEEEVIEATGHLWDEEYTVDKEATCTTDGIKSIHCQNCDEVKEVTVIPATGHTPSEDWETDEHERWKICTVCGEKLNSTSHTFGDLIIDIIPTCTKAGRGHRICSGCGYVEYEAIKAIGHSWNEEYTIDAEPTCTTDGSKSIHCQNCDEVKDREVIPATGHTPSEDWETDEHERWKVCTICGAVVEEIPHTFGDLIIDIIPTCTKPGRGHRICSGCGYEEEEVIKAIGHSWDEEYTVDAEPTCTTDGIKSIHCQNCDEVKDSEVIPATGHIPSEYWETDEHERWKVCTVCGEKLNSTSHTFGDLIIDIIPTCTKAGRGHRICSGCGYVEYEAIKAIGHSWDEEYTIDAEPTCTTDGSKSIHCQNCDEVKDSEVIPATGHTWKPDQVDKAPTCTETGIDHKECEICGHIEIFEIEATGHTPSEDWETDNHKRWRVCTVCGAVIEEIPHTFGELIVDKEPTCTEPGRGHRICSGCGYEEKESIEATGHLWDEEYTIDKEVTCTTDGIKSIHCQNCAEVKEVTVIPAPGHTPSEDWETDEHERWKVCTVCGEKLNSTSHTFGDLIIDIIPTCTKAGRGHRICSGCGYVEHEAIKAIGHSWDEEYTIDAEATCTTDGSKSIHCQNCTEVKDSEVIPATGHTWKPDQVDKAPTCTETGIDHKECAICGHIEIFEIEATGHTPSETWETDDHERWRVCMVCGAVIEEIPHTFGELIVDKEPTCIEPGRGHKICSGCGYEEEESIEATGHLWDEEYTIDKEVTCTTDGIKSIHCQNCAEVKEVTVIPAIGHTPSEDWETDEHERWKVCTVCGEKLNSTSHTFGDLIIDIIPTCTKPGRGHRICSGCGYVEYEAIKAIGHSWDEEYTIDAEATCTTDGSKSIHCQNCTEVKDSEVIPATGHTWKPDQVDKAPTCTETGIDHKECAICGHMEIFEIEATGHTPSETWETDDHERWRVCTVCGAVIEEIPHTFGELIVDKEPTCIEPGRGHKICSGCGYEEEEVIEATGHLWDEEYTVDAESTCTTDGIKSIHCQNCDEVKDREVIPATGHTESDWIVDAEADCVTAGSRHKECETCGKLFEKEIIKATGHNFGEIKTYAATCETAGYTYHICNVCGFSEKVKDIAATGHTESEWIVDAEADCVTAGSRHKECKTCGKLFEKEIIKATGHNFGEIKTYAATCETAGYTYHICTVCGFSEKVKDVAATGHTESEWIVDTEATCTASGIQHKVCTVCEKLLAIEPIPATGHTMSEGWKNDADEHWKDCTVCGNAIEKLGHLFEWVIDKEATETEKGLKHEKCTTCGYEKSAIEIPATGSGVKPFVGNVYAEVEKTHGFYFSHDNGENGGFSPKQIISLKIYERSTSEGDRTSTPWAESDIDMSMINFGDAVPSTVYDENNTTFKYEVPVFYGDNALTDADGNRITVTVYIGVKGDVDLNNKVLANDAAQVLTFYAAAQKTNAAEVKLSDSEYVTGADDVLDDFCAFLGDVDANERSEDNWKLTKAERRILANDAGSILTFYAKMQKNDAEGQEQKFWNEIVPERFGA